VIGGNGSLIGAAQMAADGLVVVGIPGTIDGDVAGAVTLGMDSALNYAVSYIDALRITAESLPDRCFLVETLGGNTGWLARRTAELCLAPVVLVPERPVDLDDAAEGMRRELAERRYSIAVMSEGVGSAVRIAARLESLIHERVRPSVIGHSMRGAPVSAEDRRLGLAFGVAAVRNGIAGRSGVLRRDDDQVVLDAFPAAQ